MKSLIRIPDRSFSLFDRLDGSSILRWCQRWQIEPERLLPYRARCYHMFGSLQILGCECSTVWEVDKEWSSRRHQMDSRIGLNEMSALASARGAFLKEGSWTFQHSSKSGSCWQIVLVDTTS